MYYLKKYLKTKKGKHKIMLSFFCFLGEKFIINNHEPNNQSSFKNVKLIALLQKALFSLCVYYYIIFTKKSNSHFD